MFEDNDSTVTFGGSGTWATYNGTGRNSGSGCRYNNTAGGTVTITLPPTFPGGTINIGSPVWGDGSSCVLTTAVNGITYTLDTAPIARTGNHPTVGLLRIPNVRRNQGTIVITVTSVSATGGARAVFDWWGWEPDEDACPVVAIVGQPKPLDYTSQAAAPAGPVTDAGVDVINQIQQEVAAEFGERVAYIDTSEIDKSTDYWEPGNVHPNGAGHAYIADQTTTALRAIASIVPSTIKDATPGAATTAYSPTFDGAGTALGNGTATGNYTINDGVVHFAATITLGSTSTVGSTGYVGLPVAEATGTIELSTLAARVFRSGDGYYPLRAMLGSATGKAILRQDALASGKVQNVSATAPLTWAAGDVLYVTGSYRPA